jgi:purine-binding chemotaxis protein CheW
MKAEDGSSRTVSKVLSEANQYLTFMLGEELYGVDILRVQEIKGYQKCTPIPNTPVFIKGVLNLRGTIVPIVDLRAKFNLPSVDATMFTVVIVVVVSEVMDIASGDIQPPPMLGTNVDVSFISGLGRCGERLITILNIDHVLSLEELLQVGSTSEETETVQV